MSADNGIYIGQFDDGWRVIHAQAIENVHYSSKDMNLYFRNAALFKSENQAIDYANILYKTIIGQDRFIEYGICNLGYLGELNAKTKVRKYRRTTKTHKKK